MADTLQKRHLDILEFLSTQDVETATIDIVNTVQPNSDGIVRSRVYITLAELQQGGYISVRWGNGSRRIQRMYRITTKGRGFVPMASTTTS